jgi:hypothetical protein
MCLANLRCRCRPVLSEAMKLHGPDSHVSIFEFMRLNTFDAGRCNWTAIEERAM